MIDETLTRLRAARLDCETQSLEDERELAKRPLRERGLG